MDTGVKEITNEEVLHLAKLARLSVPAEEIESFVGDFKSIVNYIERLNSLMVGSAEKEPVLPALHNIFREDGPADATGMWTEKITAQFPARDGNSLSVKKIITHE